MRNGVSYRTAFRRFHRGEIPNSHQNPESGRIYVDVTAEECGGACCADIHVECLVAKLREAGYVVKHQDDVG